MNSGMVVAFLLNALWQVALVAIAAACGARLLRGGCARHEHRLWVAALLVAVALPIVSTLVPVERPALSRPEATANVANGANGGLRAHRSTDIVGFTLPRPRIHGPSPNVAFWIASVYALFLATRAIVLLRGWRSTAMLRANATPATAGAVRAAAVRCRDAFALTDVPLLVSRDADAPVSIGNAVVLPAHIDEKLSEEALLSVIGHEMAHIRRRDFAINIAYEALYALIAFHPAAVIIRRRLSQTREHACDEMVSERLVKPVRYAHALLDVAAMLAPSPKPAWSLAMVDRGFEERVLRLARPRRGGAYARVMIVASCALLVSTVAVGVAFAVERRAPWSAAAPGGAGSANAAPIRAAEGGGAPLNFDEACNAGRTRDERAIPSLIALLGDETPVADDLRCYAGRWSPAIEVFVSPTRGEKAAIALASIGGASIDALIPMLDAPSAVQRRNAAWAIGEIRGSFLNDRSDAVEPLLRIINDHDATVRRAAAFTFGELRSADAIEPLINSLNDPDDAVRATAAWALGEIRARTAVSMLERVLANDRSEDARAAARYALNEILGD